MQQRNHASHLSQQACFLMSIRRSTLCINSINDPSSFVSRVLYLYVSIVSIFNNNDSVTKTTIVEWDLRKVEKIDEEIEEEPNRELGMLLLPRSSRSGILESFSVVKIESNETTNRVKQNSKIQIRSIVVCSVCMWCFIISIIDWGVNVLRT